MAVTPPGFDLKGHANSTPDTVAEAPMNDTPETENQPAQSPPDRLSTDMRSDWFNAEALQRGVGIRFNGVEKTNVEEYSVSEGWVRLAVGKSRDRKGNPMTVKMQGVVEPYFRDVAEG